VIISASRGAPAIVRRLTTALDPGRHRYLSAATGAAVAGAFTFWATDAMPYYPAAWRLLLVVAVAVAWLLRANVGRTLTAAVLVLPAAHALGLGLNGFYLVAFVAIATVLLDPYSFLAMAVTIAGLFIPSLTALVAVAPLALVVPFFARPRVGGAALVWPLRVWRAIYEPYWRGRSRAHRSADQGRSRRTVSNAHPELCWDRHHSGAPYRERPRAPAR